MTRAGRYHRVRPLGYAVLLAQLADGESDANAQLAGLVSLGGAIAPLFDKWNLGAGRIVDFAAVAALAVRFRSRLKPLAIRPLVMLGQASLEVFCVHLQCVFCALSLMGNRPLISGWAAIATVLASWSALLLTGALMARAKGGRERSGGTEPAPSRAGYGDGPATQRAT
jgi:peptidoglycan/LPS O-acetylase OafA/YrhL